MAAPRLTLSRWWIVGLLSATATAGYLCRVNLSVAGALLMEEFHLSQVEMGRVFSAFLLGYALCQLPGGLLADRIGARRVLVAITWWWVLATAMQAAIGTSLLPASAAVTLVALAVARFVMGVGAAPTYPAAAQGVSRWVPPAAQGRATGLVIASVGIGSALAPPLISNVMVRWGWRASLLASAIPAFFFALVWLAIREPAPTAAEAPLPVTTRPRLTRALATRNLALLTLSYSLQGYVGYIFVFWFYLYLVQVRHFDLLKGAWLSSLPWVLSIVSIPAGGFVSDWLSRGALGPVWGRRLVAMVGLAGSGVLISLGARTGNAYLAAAYLALATALVLSVEGPFWATAVAVAGPHSGAAGGIMNTGCNIGGLISPALTPVLASAIGWEMALHLAAALAVAGGLLWFWITPKAHYLNA